MVRPPKAGGARADGLSDWRGPRSDENVVAWAQARWKRPLSLTEEEAAGLCTVVQFSVSPMRRVWNVRREPIRSSGNADFDESVRLALESAIDERATVPAPPHDLVGDSIDYRIEVTGGGKCRAR